MNILWKAYTPGWYCSKIFAARIRVRLATGYHRFIVYAKHHVSLEGSCSQKKPEFIIKRLLVKKANEIHVCTYKIHFTINVAKSKVCEVDKFKE